MALLPPGSENGDDTPASPSARRRSMPRTVPWAVAQRRHTLIPVCDRALRQRILRAIETPRCWRQTLSTPAEGAWTAPQTLDTDELKAVMSADLFADVPRGSFDALLPRCQIVELDEGNTLIERGARNEYVFVVLRGSLRVEVDDAQAAGALLLRPG